MNPSPCKKVQCSLGHDSQTTLDGLGADKISENEFGEDYEFLGHLLAIAILTVTIVLFV